MKKRWLSVLLCAAMLVSMIPAALAASDIDTHWAKKYITYLDQEGVINPSAKTGLYTPDAKITRAEFMRYINRAFHFEETTAISYSDVKTTAWYYDTVRIAKKYGYISGVGGGKMDPDGKITREQAAVIIGRLFKADPGSVKPSDLSFTDKAQISTWSAGYIKAAQTHGIIAGYNDGSFRPQQTISRAEVAKILYAYMGSSLSSAGKAYSGTDLKSDTANVTISENCTLSDAIIEGDLYLTEGLGSDAVTLNNVTVKGTIILSGGTVTMSSVTCENMIVSSPMGRLLHVTATGATNISNTEVRSAATLYEKVLTGDGFSEITVDGSDRVSLTLDAAVDKLTLASEATISTTAGTNVYHLIADKAASITGYGSVYQADVNAAGVSFASSVTVSGYKIADGISATIGGQAVSGTTAASISPTRIDVDLNDLSAYDTGAAISLPTGAKTTMLMLDGAIMTAGTDYETSATGVTLKKAWIASLTRGNHTVIITMDDGSKASITVAVTNSAAAATTADATFDRYYKSSGFQDVSVKLNGVEKSTDIRDVVLGLSRIEYGFDMSTKSLILRRGLLAQLREGTYTVTVDLENNKQIAVNLAVTDSSPDGVAAYVSEYDTYSPAPVSFSIAQVQNGVKAITATKNGTAATLAAGTDYTLTNSTLTLTKTGLENFRRSGSYVEFTVTMTDGSTCLLVIDYV